MTAPGAPHRDAGRAPTLSESESYWGRSSSAIATVRGVEARGACDAANAGCANVSFLGGYLVHRFVMRFSFRVRDAVHI